MPTYAGVIHDEGGAAFNVRSATYGGTYNANNEMTNATTVFATVLAAVPDGGTILIPPGTYLFTAGTRQLFTKRVTVLAYGAVLQDYRFQADEGIHWYGGTLTYTSVPADANAVARLTNATDPSRIQDMDIDWDALVNTGPYTGIEIQGGEVHVTNSTIRMGGRSAITLLGSKYVHLKGLNLIANPAGSPDDGLVLKATTGVCENVIVEDLMVEHHATGFAIGTQVLAEYAVRAVLVKGMVARNVTYPVWIKPGNGMLTNLGPVEDIRIEGVVALDPSGAKMQVPVEIFARPGAKVRNVSVQGVSARGRTASTSSARAFVRLYASGTGARIERVSVRDADFRDEYGGVANGPSAPGNPFVDAVNIEVTGGGAVADLTLDGIVADGLARGGVVVENGGGTLEGRITVLNLLVRDGNSSISTAGVVSVSGWDAVIKNVVAQSPGSLAGSVLPVTGSGKIFAEETACVFGTVAAGTAASRVLWTAPWQCWVYGARVINGAAIAQSDTDYSTFILQNVRPGNTQQIATATTRVTSGIAIAQTSAAFSAANFVSAGAYLKAGDTVRLDKADTGAGRATDEMKVVLLYVPIHSE